MRVDGVKSNIPFKSGYPTFGSNGHLSYIPDKHDLVYIGFRPTGGLKRGQKLDVKA